MKKIKDFIYNFSDIAVALAILVIASGIILWRMDAIINYPSTVIGETTEEETYEEELIDEPVVEQEEETEESEETVEETPVVEPEVTKAVYENGKLTEEITVKVSGSTATQAIQCLIDVGIFDDFDDFKNYANEAGKNYNCVKGGKMTFKAGSTKKQIANQMTYK